MFSLHFFAFCGSCFFQRLLHCLYQTFLHCRKEQQRGTIPATGSQHEALKNPKCKIERGAKARNQLPDFNQPAVNKMFCNCKNIDGRPSFGSMPLALFTAGSSITLYWSGRMEKALAVGLSRSSIREPGRSRVAQVFV